MGIDTACGRRWEGEMLMMKLDHCAVKDGPTHQQEMSHTGKRVLVCRRHRSTFVLFGCAVERRARGAGAASQFFDEACQTKISEQDMWSKCRPTYDSRRGQSRR